MGAAVMRTYADLFTWSHPYADRAVLHDDGAVSVLIEWQGVDAELMSADEKAALWRSFYRVFELLEPGWCVEWHLWREPDDPLIATYETRPLLRGEMFGRFVRQELGAFVRCRALVNTVGLVISQRPPRRRWFLRRALEDQAARAAALLQSAERLCAQLPGAQVADILQFGRRVWQGTMPRPLTGCAPTAVDPRLQLNEQWIRTDPEQLMQTPRDRDIVLLALYPDAYPGWAEALAGLAVPLHVCQIVQPLARRAALARVERDRQLARGLMRRGRTTSESATVTALGTFL
ncbi:MAG TPA: hypothetical protein VFN52_07050, partial [Acidiferrobacteraceae bacterium]|nr:hypothetical protein [Acidiferrobacteraceae bacterium]